MCSVLLYICIRDLQPPWNWILAIRLDCMWVPLAIGPSSWEYGNMCFPLFHGVPHVFTLTTLAIQLSQRACVVQQSSSFCSLPSDYINWRHYRSKDTLYMLMPLLDIFASLFSSFVRESYLRSILTGSRAKQLRTPEQNEQNTQTRYNLTCYFGKLMLARRF